MTPAARPKPRRNETTQLVIPILAAVNALPGVRVWRPHVLSSAARDVSGAGLAVGSADLIGICVRTVVFEPYSDGMKTAYPHEDIGRFLALEVKWPGQKPTPDQRLWAEVVRKLGGFYAVVHSIADGVAAVERCRNGERE